jgi:hypothetical protein
MSRLKAVLLSVVAVFTVSTFASATASANTSHVFLIEQTELGSGGNPTTEAIEDQGGNGKLETRIAGLPVYLECQENLSTGEIKKEGKSTFKIEFKNCFLVEKSKEGKKVFLTACTVEEPVISEGTDELIEHSVDKFVGGKGAEELFAEVKIKGEACAAKGNFKAKNFQLCSMPESEFEKVLHWCIFTPAGSKLVFGGEPAQLFGEDQFKLKSQKRWSTT